MRRWPRRGQGRTSRHARKWNHLDAPDEDPAKSKNRRDSDELADALTGPERTWVRRRKKMQEDAVNLVFHTVRRCFLGSETTNIRE